jgi:hypothetical protein
MRWREQIVLCAVDCRAIRVGRRYCRRGPVIARAGVGGQYKIEKESDMANGRCSRLDKWYRKQLSYSLYPV